MESAFGIEHGEVAKAFNPVKAVKDLKATAGGARAARLSSKDPYKRPRNPVSAVKAKVATQSYQRGQNAATKMWGKTGDNAGTSTRGVMQRKTRTGRVNYDRGFQNGTQRMDRVNRPMGDPFS